MKIFDYLKWAQTGDIVLMSGSSGFAKVIKELTGSKWSHVAITVRGEDVGLSKGIYVWEATGRGVGEVDFLQACRIPDTSFLSRMANYDAGDVGVRPISGERTPLMLENLKRHMEQYRGSSYETDKLEMLKAVHWVKACGLSNNEQALATQYCWEAAAAALQALGMFPTDRPANSYSNVDFAGNALVCTAESGASVNPLVLLEFLKEYAMFFVCILLLLGLLSVGVSLGIMNGWFIKNVPSNEDQGCLFMVFLIIGIVCIGTALERAYQLGL